MNYFITGGSRGIGASIVKYIAQEGHNVAFTYLRNIEHAQEVEKLARNQLSARKVKSYQMDVRNLQSVEKVTDQVLEDFDTIDVIVNNAGICRDNLLISMSNEEWDDIIATNLTGPFYVCRQFMPTLLAQRFGRIINISSLSAQGKSGQCNYAAAKAGLQGLTRSIAKEYGRKGITANVLALGYFETDMTHGLSDSVKEFWRTYCPMPKGRPGHFDEISGTINFLTSPAGGYINGQIIPINGGLDWSP